jgi:PAS domain S-box-containing protein
MEKESLLNQMKESSQNQTRYNEKSENICGEQNKSEGISREVYESYKALMNNSVLGITIVDKEYKIIMTNTTFCELFKKSAEEFAGKYCFKEYEKRDEVCPHCPGRRAMISGKPEEAETLAVLDNGTRIHVRNRAIPFFSDDGTIKGFIEMIEDIDKRKKAEEALQKSEERFKIVAENSGDWIWEIDKDGLYTYSSPIVEKILGYTSEEIVGKRYFYEFFIPENRDRYKEAAFSTFSKKESFIGFVNSNTHKNGNVIILETNGSPVMGEKGNLIGYRGVDRDITERKKAEDQLRKNEEHLKLLLNSISAGVVMIDAQTHEIVDCNCQAEKMLGMAKEKILRKICHRFICPADKGKCPISDLGQKLDMSERVLLKTEHDTIPILKTVTPITWCNHSYYIESFIDITRLKKTEKALWTSEERFRTAAKLASDLIWELNIKTGRMEWYGDIDGKLGYEKGQFPRTLQAWESIIHPDDYSRIMKELEEHFKEGKSYNTEYRVKHKNGEYLYWTDSGTTLPDAEGKPDRMIGVCTDVTNRRNSEQKQNELLEQFERVNEELNSFAYIVSHDLKAPLRGVKVLAEWLRTDYADKLGEEGKNQMELLVSRVDRMHNLIDGILQYSRIGRTEEDVSEIDTEKVVADVIDMISPPKNIRIVVEGTLPVIKSEKTRIIQVFQNLISNAVKYMDKEDGIIKVRCAEEDKSWKFSIEDNGPGIAKEYYEKIFQMFQTLSPRDKYESTGVGLTVVKKIIELYGGRVWVESQVGKGSTFIFTIPRQEVINKRIKDEKLQANYVS